MFPQPLQLPLTFDGWCARTHPHPIIPPSNRRTGNSSTGVADGPVPITVEFWAEFPQWVETWKNEMVAKELPHRFPYFAKLATQAFTTGPLFPAIIQDEFDASRTLHSFFDMAITSMKTFINSSK